MYRTGLGQWIREICARIRDRMTAPGNEDIESLMSWSISSELAALPEVYLRLFPPDVALIVEQAKSLHPVVARRQAEQADRIARDAIGFVPQHHVYRLLGQWADHFVGIPEVNAERPMTDEVLLERARFERERIQEALHEAGHFIPICDPWGNEFKESDTNVQG